MADGVQRGPMIASAVIGAVALIGVLVVAFATDDKATGSGVGTGEHRAIIGGSGLSGGSGTSGGAGQHAGGRASGGSNASGGSGGGSSPRPAVSQQYLKTHFPLPPGTRPYPRPDEIPHGQLWYVNNSLSLETVRTYYQDQAFASLGLTCSMSGTIKGTTSHRGQLIGYVGEVASPQNPHLAHVQVRHFIEGLPPATVFIQAEFF